MPRMRNPSALRCAASGSIPFRVLRNRRDDQALDERQRMRAANLRWLPTLPLRHVGNESPILGELLESALGFHLARILGLPLRLFGMPAILFGFCRRAIHGR